MNFKFYPLCKQFIIGVLFLCLFSCNNNKKNDALFKALDEGLVNSNAQLDNTIRQIFIALKQRIEDPEYKAKTKEIVPNAISIHELSNSTVDYIEEIKKAVLNKSNDEIHDYFFKGKRGIALFDILKAYKNKLQILDSLLDTELENVYSTTAPELGKIYKSDADFANTFFDNSTSTSSIAMLSKFQNSIKIIEVSILTNYLKQTEKEVSICGFSHSPYPIAFADNTHVKAGEIIEITAGIGDFFTSLNKTISISGNKITENQWGVSVTKVTAANNLGKHFIPVTIEYIKPDGSKATITKNIIYYVDSCR
jgi:hypothetical protein